MDISKLGIDAKKFEVDTESVPPSPPAPAEARAPDGITRRFMDSKVLGAVVPICWTADGGTVWVDGVPYSASEVGELMARRPGPETMRLIHRTKQTFRGTVH